MSFRFFTCLIFFLLLLRNINHSHAQYPVSFDHLGIEKGLSQSSVISIAQDNQGFMWFGTRLGLNRYDGYRFKVYETDSKNQNSISNNYILSIFKDSKNKLWIGTVSGLNIYSPDNDNFIRVQENGDLSPFHNNTVNCITEDKTGNIWVGTLKGIYIFKKGLPQNAVHIAYKGKADFNVKAIKQDSKGTIWLGTAAGLFKIAHHSRGYQIHPFSSELLPEAISNGYISSVLEDAEHRIWVGTQKDGVFLFNREDNSFKNYQSSQSHNNALINNTVRSLELDEKGNLWIGTLDGLSIYNKKSDSFINQQFDPGNRESLNQNSIYKLFRDKNGIMWVGTYFGGVNVNYPYHTTFKIYQRGNSGSSINNNVISSFAEDFSKNLWIGTEGGGLNLYQNNQYKVFKSSETNGWLKSNLIKKIYFSKDNKLWIGTHSGGLSCYDIQNKQFKNFEFDRRKNITAPDEIVAMAEDGEGRMWVATQHNGLKISNVEKTAFSDYKLPKKFPSAAKIKFIIIRKKIYLGTNYGLFILNPESDEFYSIKPLAAKKALDLYVNALLETKNGEVYIGTYNAGLVKYDQKKNILSRFTKKSGLPHDNICSMQEDDNGNIWIGTANGLSMFDPISKNFKNYMISDGLPGNEFNVNAAFTRSDGEMLFGGVNGFIGFYPKLIQDNRRISKMIFTDLTIDNQSIPISPDKHHTDQADIQKIKLESNQNTFTLNFALLNFIKPEKNQYLYKLEGFETKWNRSSTPSSTYTNLPSGTYRFTVKGINNDGISSSNILHMDITIKPPFYRSWWAYLFYVAIISGIVFLLMRYLLMRAVLKKEKEISMHKLDFFTNISHEIRTPLTLILGPLEKLIEDTRDQWKWNRELQPIKDNADRLMRLVTELLDFRKAESGKMQLEVSPGNIVQFCKEIFLAFRHLAQEKQVDYRFECESEDIKLYFDQKQLEKVLYNLLSNAFKFGIENGRVVLRIELKDHEVQISVSNDGKGIPYDIQPNLFEQFYQANPGLNIGTGIGLSFSKTIVALHHGKITFESTPETIEKTGFTKFTISLKTGKSFFSANELVEDDREYEALSGYSYSPLPLKADTEEENTRADTRAATRCTILLVEDNQDIRFFIKSYLNEDYEIISCENGLQGWEYATEHIPDIIISDVMMPEMDGLTLCAQLKTDNRTNHIPVILLTARSAYVHQIGGLETGADVYMTKPFNIKMLKLHIRNLISAREHVKTKFSNVMKLEPTNIIIKKSEEEFLSNLINIIEDNISEPDFDVPQLALKIGMSQPVLYKKLRALSGQSVNDLIKSIRLKRAAQLFAQKAGNVSEVAYLVGFNDRKYFSSEFKKAFGVNPRDYQG